VLERFLGKDHAKSTLQKNQIEVICPVCGAVQIEPRLVVTTLCRKCGEHLRIENRRVIASSRINPVPSAVYPTELEDSGASPVAEKSPLASAPPESASTSPKSSLGFGDMLASRHRKSSVKKSEPAAASQPASAKPDPAPPAVAPPAASAPQSTLLRMKEQGQFRQHYFKEAECFECHNKFKVGRSAKSAGCPNCGANICLEDFDINISSTAPIHTRGDVLIRKTANVTTSEICCRDLRVFGAVSARIECRGELLIRCTGTIIGEIQCRKLVIDKGCDVHILNTVNAGEVEVRARIFANIHCTGPVRISPTGWVHGDVTARSVAIEPGGQLDGSMNILRSTPAPAPAASVLASIAASAAPQPLQQSVLPLAEQSV
jgi:cytoskeletal protein CcmA (bactofilin family)